MPDLEAGARKEPQRTSGAPYPGSPPAGDGPEHEGRRVPTQEELEQSEGRAGQQPEPGHPEPHQEGEPS